MCSNCRGLSFAEYGLQRLCIGSELDPKLSLWNEEEEEGKEKYIFTSKS